MVLCRQVAHALRLHGIVMVDVPVPSKYFNLLRGMLIKGEKPPGSCDRQASLFGGDGGGYPVMRLVYGR
jgi:hypothetical protein